MSGIHQFTSSQWVQKGSTAVFKSGINVTGSISATGTISAATFVGDGSGLTGVGQADFFAGNRASITASTPASLDTFINLQSGVFTASDAFDPVIVTTHSANFTPNHFSFYKLTDEGFELIQSGPTSFYSSSDRTSGGDPFGDAPFENDKAPGVHRYMVSAVDTGSGVGHNLFTTITIKGFVNEPPSLVLPEHRDIFIPHDSHSADLVFHFTNSVENQSADGDVLRRIEVTRSSANPTNQNFHQYSMVIKNATTQTTDTNGHIIFTQSQDQGANSFPTAASALSDSDLTFTASVTGYDVVGTGNLVISQSNNLEPITASLLDNNRKKNQTTGSFNFVVHTPPTASITNIRAEVESGSYTGYVGTYYEVPMLYDKNVLPTSKVGLPEEYTQSLVRIRTCAEIHEPPGYTADESHTTKIRINTRIDDELITDLDTQLFWFQMKGHSGTSYTASSYGNSYSNSDITANVTESEGWVPLALGVSNKYYGAVADDNELDDVQTSVRHGNRNHFNASSADAIRIVVTSIPNVEISEIKVQLESSSFSNDVVYERTGSILYGYDSTLLQNQTSSLLGFTKQNEYISESVIRYRVLAKITEPFGPDHRNTIVNILKDGSNIHTLDFNTSSVHCTSNDLDSDKRRVSHYTSSWQSSSFVAGDFVISANFSSQANNTGQTVASITSSNLKINGHGAIEQLNGVTEIEKAYKSSEPHFTTADGPSGDFQRISRILYGFTSSLRTDETASLVGFDRENDYISESVIRIRLKTKIQEPFGPKTSVLTASFSNGPQGVIISTASAQVDSTGSGEIYDDNNRRIFHYTSSWLEHNYTSGTKTLARVLLAEPEYTINEIGQNVFGSISMSAPLKTEVVATMSYEKKWDGSNPSNEETQSRSARILYGYTSTLLSTETSSQLTNQVNYRATHSTDAVIRHRIRALVKEPFGPHTTTTIVAPNVGSFIYLHTASSNTVASSASSFEPNTSRSLIEYTSSWFESKYTTDNTITSAIITDGSNGNTYSVTTPTLTIINPEDPIISFVTKIEANSFESGDGVSSNRTSTFLHGRVHPDDSNISDMATITDLTENSGYPNHSNAKAQLVRSKVFATVQEGFGPKAATFTTNHQFGGSAVHNDVPISISSASGVDHSETDGKFNYEFTNSFTPIRLQVVGANTVTVADPSTDLTGTPQVTKTPATVTMNDQPNSIITFNSLTTSGEWSSSGDLTNYYVSNTTENQKSNLTIIPSVTHFPPELSVFNNLAPMNTAHKTLTYTTTDSDTTLSTSGFNGEVQFSNINGYSSLKTVTVTGKAESTPPGDVDEAEAIKTIDLSILPNAPKSIDGKYWGVYTGSSHGLHESQGTPGVALNHGKLYSGVTPSSSNWHQSGSQTGGNNVDRKILIVNNTDGTSPNHNIDLALPTGVYGRGDKGALELKINGERKAYIDLSGSFVSARSNSFQNYSGLTQSFGSGNAMTASVAVYKNMSQRFYNGTEIFPFGYQQWSVNVQLREKFRNGYNYLELLKSSGSVTESLQVFDWYYDEYKPTDFISTPVTWSWATHSAAGSSPTRSLSGVSYFINGVEFEVSYSNKIKNLANETYQSTFNLGTVQSANALFKLESGSSYLQSVNMDPGEGLTWSSHDATDTSIPEIGATASLGYKAKWFGTSTTPTNVQLNLAPLKRNLSSHDGTLQVLTGNSPTAGRFVGSTVFAVQDTDSVANFYDESYRIPSSSLANLNDVQSDYDYWLTTSYDSTELLTDNDQLQQTLDGHLVYPTLNYTTGNIFNPNAPDYTSATGDRFWYRAIRVQGITGTGDKLIKIKIGMPNTNAINSRRDIWAADPEGDGDTVGFDTRDIRIRCKIPGPINSSGNQGSSFPGTAWAAVCGRDTNQTAPNIDNWFFGNNASFSYSSGYVSINWNTGTYAIDLADQIAIVEIRLKPTATESRHVISSIELEDVD